MLSGRERRGQIDADQDHGRRDASRPPAPCSSTAARAFASPAQAMARGVAMVFQETSLVPTMTVAQNLYLGDEKFFNRLRGIYIAAQHFLQSLNFPSTRRATSRRSAPRKTDGRDRPRGSPEGAHHHLRRADGLADAGREGPFLLACSAAGSEACRSSSSRMRSKRRSRSPTASRSCATASWSPPTRQRFDRDKIIRAMVGRALSKELYRGQRPRRARPAWRRC